jgi:hypothetical protein
VINYDEQAMRVTRRCREAFKAEYERLQEPQGLPKLIDVSGQIAFAKDSYAILVVIATEKGASPFIIGQGETLEACVLDTTLEIERLEERWKFDAIVANN